MESFVGEASIFCPFCDGLHHYIDHSNTRNLGTGVPRLVVYTLNLAVFTYRPPKLKFR